METKKNNNIHVAIEVILLAIILGLGVYIAYSKGIILNKEKPEDKNNKQQEEKVKKEETEEEVKIPTDMEKVNKELNSYLSKYLTHNGEVLNKNILSDPSSKFKLINFLLTEDGNYSFANKLGGEWIDSYLIYVDMNTYKAKYKKIYGNLENFDTEMKTAESVSIILQDSIAWSSLVAETPYKARFEAKNITYDKSSKQYKITGVVNYESDGVITPQSFKHDFELIYANNTEQNYLISLVLS